jgi:hypothetical protein
MMALRTLAASAGIALSMVAVLGCTHATSAERDIDTLRRERHNLKNAAFCSCLRHALPEGNDLLAEDGSLAGYMETGAHDLDAFAEVDRAAATAAKESYSSKHGRPLAIMKCLSFYNSPELDSLVRSLDEKIITNGVQP